MKRKPKTGKKKTKALPASSRKRGASKLSAGVGRSIGKAGTDDRLFLALAENSPDVIFVMDMEGTLVYANRAFERITGFKRDEVYSKDFEADVLIAPESRGVVAKKKREQLQKGKRVRAFPFEAITKDGKRHSLLISTTPIVYRGSAAILGIATDVSEEEKVKRALRASEKKYTDFFNNAPIGTYRTTREGRMLMANPALVKMLGFSSFQEIAGRKNVKSFYHHDTPRSRFVERMEKEGKVKGFESKLVKKDGTVLYARENARCIRDDAGNIVCYEGSIEDVTDQKLAEEQKAYRARFEKVILQISTRFINLSPDELHDALNIALKSIGTFAGADRAYVFLFSDDGKTMDNTNEWAAEGIDPKIDELKNIDVDMFLWSISRLRKRRVIHIPSVEDMPPEASAEREEFESEDIQSLVLVPLACGQSVLGFVGFDSVWEKKSWDDNQIDLLKLSAQIFASAIERTRAEDELRYRVDFEELIASISSSFINLSPSRTNMAINEALRDLGEFIGADRCFLCHVDEAASAILRTHDWIAPGGTHGEERPARMCLEEFPWEIDLLKKLQPMQLSVGDMCDGAKRAHELMCAYGVRSMVAVPFLCGKKKLAFLGVLSENEDRQRSNETVSLLSIAAEMFASALERRDALAALQEERRLVDALMDNIPDHIYFKDLDSRFVRVNKAQAQRFGLANPEDAIGKTDHDYFTREHADQALSDEKEVIRTGNPLVDKEEKETWQDGSETWVSTTKLPLRDKRGNVVGTFGLSRDITSRRRVEYEKRKIEAQMQHAQKLESLGVLAGGIAHDFNNLLMGILGNTGLALMELGPESPALESVKQIETVALRAAELTNQMLAYSGKSKFIVRPFSLAKLVKEMSHLLEVSISKQAKLIYEFDEDLPMMEGDPVQIRQVVMNLITNASDAIGDRTGTIVIRTGMQECREEYLASCFVGKDLPEGPYLYIEVSDTGCGMDSSTLERIFDPFFTTKSSGRGLGLAAAIGIVHAHRGALRVYSEPGKGTDFKVLFPYSENDVEETEPEKEDFSAWQGAGAVLVIDDDEIVLNVTERILRKLGFRAFTVTTGEEALMLCRENSSGLVAALLDVTMPEMTSDNMVKQLKAIKKDLPVILISGYNEQAATVGMSRELYDGFVQKPFDANALAKILRSILERE